MNDEIIDKVLARGVHAEACNTHLLVGWIVMRQPPGYPSKFMGRLVTCVPSAYILIADTLRELRAKLPPMLEWSERQPSDLSELVEIWFSR